MIPRPAIRVAQDAGSGTSVAERTRLSIANSGKSCPPVMVKDEILTKSWKLKFENVSARVSSRKIVFVMTPLIPIAVRVILKGRPFPVNVLATSSEVKENKPLFSRSIVTLLSLNA